MLCEVHCSNMQQSPVSVIMATKKYHCVKTKRKDFDITSPIPKLCTAGCFKFSRETYLQIAECGNTVSDECEAIVINCLDLTTE
jgi:hypothetical protein